MSMTLKDGCGVLNVFRFVQGEFGNSSISLPSVAYRLNNESNFTDLKTVIILNITLKNYFTWKSVNRVACVCTVWRVTQLYDNFDKRNYNNNAKWLGKQTLSKLRNYIIRAQNNITCILLLLLQLLLYYLYLCSFD